jgi:hypothetical protein
MRDKLIILRFAPAGGIDTYQYLAACCGKITDQIAVRWQVWKEKSEENISICALTNDRRLIACQNSIKDKELTLRVVEMSLRPSFGGTECILLLLMSVFPKTFLTLVRSHFMSFSLFSAWHSQIILIVI